MDCCDFVSTDVSFALLGGVAFAVLCVYFNCLSPLKNFFNRNKHSSEYANIKGAICQSPYCVRCTSDPVLHEIIKNRFIKYSRSEKKKELCRLENSILFNNKPILDQNPYILFLHDLSSTVWFESKLIYKYDIEKLENAFSDIVEEFWRINGEDGWIISEKKEGCWRMFHLISQGNIVERNASKCPKTMSAIKNLDHMMLGTVFGYATFSVMEPGTVIYPHYGSTNCRVRCHLGLEVDPDICYIEADGQRRSWEVGKCLMFDDSFLHSAYHKGTKEHNARAILMIDMWHPGLNKSEINCIKTVYSADLI